MNQACYELHKSGGGRGGDGCIDGKRDGVYNRCLLMKNYEKSMFMTYIPTSTDIEGVEKILNEMHDTTITEVLMSTCWRIRGTHMIPNK